MGTRIVNLHRAALITLALASWTPSVLGQGFGSLFTSPEERAYLDYLRNDFLERSAAAGFNIDEATVPTIPVAETDAPTGQAIFHLGGILNGRTGGRTIWLNGSAVAESDLPANVRVVQLDGITALRIRSGTTDFVIKPGQTLNLRTGRLMDAYEGQPTDEAANEGSVEEQTTATAQPVEPDAEAEAPAALPATPPILEELIRALQTLQETSGG